MASTVNSALRNAVFGLMRHISEATRRDILAGLINADANYEIFQAIGKEFGIKDITIDGKIGQIMGSLRDNRIMAAYARGEVWADDVSALLIDFFTTHGVGSYLDIGANIGLTTIPVAQKFPTLVVNAFEPDPTNFRYLQYNVAANCPKSNVMLSMAAVVDYTGTIDFELDLDNQGDHRIHHSSGDGLYHESSRPIVKVRSISLDDMFDTKAMTRPIVIKIDTQGAEARIFAGGARTIANADMVSFEFMPYLLDRAGGDFQVLLKVIKDNFAEGAITTGDQHRSGEWQPIAEIVDTMINHYDGAEAHPYRYDDVLARK